MGCDNHPYIYRIITISNSMYIDLSYDDKAKILRETFGITDEKRIQEEIEHNHDSAFYSIHFDFIPLNK